MKKNLTELVFVIDRSGSMSGKELDTIGGFNATIERNRTAEGEAVVTTVLFDTTETTLHSRADIREVRPMTERDYRVGGCTALLDALGGAIERTKFVHSVLPEEYVPEHTCVVVITDGLENASTKFSYAQVKELIEGVQGRSWEVLYLGANIDAAKEAGRIGIRQDRAANFVADSYGVGMAYEAVGDAVATMRRGAPIGANWSAKVEADHKRRNRRR